MTIIAPSILACDWGSFREEVLALEKAGADWIHIDVMDGHFVPPLTFGPGVVSAIRTVTTLPLDVHLMVDNPDSLIPQFAKAGADIITIHADVCPHLHRTIQSIKELGKKAGVSINPATPLSTLNHIISELDLILIMSVNPGWGGQKFIEACEEKITQAASMAATTTQHIEIEVDGGINAETSIRATKAGATALVAGTYIFGNNSYKNAIDSLKAS